MRRKRFCTSYWADRVRGGNRREQSYISPQRLISAFLASRPERRSRIPPRLVVVYDPELFRAIRGAVGAEPMADWMYVDRPMRQLFVAPDLPGVAFLHTEIGAPLIAYLLELFAACGLRDVLIVTSAGAVSADAASADAVSAGWDVGSLFVVGSALSRNGATAALFPGREEFTADDGATEELRSRFAAAGYPAPVVRALSCDLFFQDAPGFWDDPVSDDGGGGYGAGSAPDIVEMELATVFAVAEKCGLRACAAGYVADMLSRTWERPQQAYYPAERLQLVPIVRAFAAQARLPASRGRCGD